MRSAAWTAEHARTPCSRLIAGPSRLETAADEDAGAMVGRFEFGPCEQKAVNVLPNAAA